MSKMTRYPAKDVFFNLFINEDPPYRHMEWPFYKTVHIALVHGLDDGWDKKQEFHCHRNTIRYIEIAEEPTQEELTKDPWFSNEGISYSWTELGFQSEREFIIAVNAAAWNAKPDEDLEHQYQVDFSYST